MSPDTANQGADPAAEAVSGADPSAQSPDGGSGQDWLDRGQSEESITLRELLRDPSVSRITATSKLSDPASDGGSAPSGDVKPSEPVRGTDGRFVPRRGVSKALAEADEKVAAADPDAIRAQVRAEIEAEARTASEAAAQAAMAERESANAALYEGLLHLPDSDPKLNELTADGTQTLYQWREDRKELLRQFPTAERHYREQYGRQVSELDRKQSAFWDDVKGQFATAAGRRGVDPEAFRTMGRFDEMADHMYEAGRASVLEENRRLARENQQLRLQGPRGLSAARAPLSGGRSSAGAPALSDNDLLRAFLRGSD